MELLSGLLKSQSNKKGTLLSSTLSYLLASIEKVSNCSGEVGNYLVLIASTLVDSFTQTAQTLQFYKNLDVKETSDFTAE